MHKDRFFYKHADGEYELLIKHRDKSNSNYEIKEPSPEEILSDSCAELIFDLAAQQKERCKAEILAYLRSLSASEFEEFSELFLNSYGFKSMNVFKFNQC